MRYLLGVIFLVLVACSSGSEPEVEFLSPTVAKVTYQGKEYLLEKDQPPPPDFPLAYRFEDDGDLDLKIAGRWVEFDNPYDVDLDFKIKKRKKTLLKTKKSLRPKTKRRKRR